MTNPDLVQVETPDRVRLDGALFRASRPTRLGVDLMIFHHGVGGSFYRPSLAAALTDRLVDEGCSVLRVNNRGHDHMYSSSDGWLGAAFEIVDDCRLDYTAWLDFAEASGFRNIALWGHSLGAVKSIYYLALERDARIVCAIASSPPRFHFESFVAGPGGTSRAASISTAEAHIAAGHPGELVLFDIELARPMWFSALSSFDKYGPADRYDFFEHLPNIEIPVLLTIGSLEGGFSFDAFAAAGPELERTYEQVTFRAIHGADHSYLRHADAVWSVAHEWLTRIVAVPPA